jgi:hypothetical protein
MTNFRTFGMEFECFHPTQDAASSTAKIIRAITNMGYRAKSSNYTGRDYDQWQVKPDGSLSPYGKALELVAPTLPGTPESFEQVRKVVEWLGANGFDVNRSCGFHVHINAADLTAAEQAAVAFRYHLHRADINAVLPPSRHNGSYCMALDNRAEAKVKQALGGRATVWGHDERRVAVNLEHANSGPSGRRIEFRQHSGTLNWGKIFGWYSLLCDFVAETVRLYRAAPVQAPATAAFAAPQRRRGTRTVSHRVGTHQPRVPYIEAGSDYDLFLTAIENNGVVTQQDGRTFGWPETRLRVTAHWLRQRGAALVTTERNGELAYVAREGARDRQAIFINEGVIRVRTAAIATVASAPMQAAPVAPVNREAALAAPFVQGLSATTLAWYRQRREDFGNT